MTLWHRAPREGYRVYGEDEYLADDTLSADEESFAPHVAGESFAPHVAEESWAQPTGEESHRTPTHEHATYHYSAVAPPSHRSRSGRLVGLGLLAGVTLGAFGLVALNATHRSPAAPSAAVAQTAHPDAAAHASTGVPADHGSVVHMPNSHAPRARVRARAHADTHARGATHFSTEHPSTGHPSTGHPSTGHASTGHPSTWRVGEPALPGGPAESVSKGTSAAASTESAQPWQSTTSEPMGSGAQAPPIGGEFEFER